MRLHDALNLVPDEAVKWRPSPGKWSVHEIVCHCADSEMNGAIRLRYEVKDGFAVPGSPGSVDFRARGAHVENDYLLSRVRFHAGYWRFQKPLLRTS